MQLEEPKTQVFDGIGRTQDWITVVELKKTHDAKNDDGIEKTHGSINLLELEEPMREDIFTQL